MLRDNAFRMVATRYIEYVKGYYPVIRLVYPTIRLLIIYSWLENYYILKEANSIASHVPFTAIIEKKSTIIGLPRDSIIARREKSAERRANSLTCLVTHYYGCKSAAKIVLARR